uniref:Uncharacterized protein n=1 Tax=Oryzias sinensis TaxID=183150 RepID=A0A8C7YM66_9TELE
PPFDSLHTREAELGEFQSVISRLASRLRTSVRLCDRPRSGGPPVTDLNHDQNRRTPDFSHGLANTTQLQARLPDVRATRVTPLTPKHCGEHSRWGQNPVTCTIKQWYTVLFTDGCWSPLTACSYLREAL